MIKEYVGIMYREGVRDEDHSVDVKSGDGYVHGVCDMCGESVEDFDVGALVTSKEDAYCIEDAARDNDWVVIGNHLICQNCLRKVIEMKSDIEIVEKGANNG